jgi:hypothetical protein
MKYMQLQLITSLIPTLIFLLTVLIGILFTRNKISLDYFLLFFIAIAYSLLLNLPGLLLEKKGIYSIYSSNFNWASGHADLLNRCPFC